MSEVVVVTGIGGMGVACARRLGAGRELVVADFDEKKLERERRESRRRRLRRHRAARSTSPIRASVDALARGRRAASAPLRTLVHTAGPLADAGDARERVLEVDMLGTDHVLNAFLDVSRPTGTVAVCIASMAGYDGGADPRARARARGRADRRAARPRSGRSTSTTSASTYGIAKRINQLRVEQAAAPWGQRGGRVVSISPGIISTPMGRQELAEGASEQMQGMLDISPVPRIGTAEDIAPAVAVARRARRRRSSVAATSGSTAA